MDKFYLTTARKDLRDNNISLPVGNTYVPAKDLVDIPSISVSVENSHDGDDHLFLFWNREWMEAVNIDFE
ncbi:MAG: hypothetical protein LBL58_13820 [Tannerellaceae bacterium]|jgi:hypothetical protein|nr:hypothetical protein [Tannerellaceae bacterium]